MIVSIQADPAQADQCNKLTPASNAAESVLKDVKGNEDKLETEFRWKITG